ncbi:uncharacterized protein LOC133186955 [Saccostrea echinata]|uniref:uncharacterized protein LOC133186955 n=1 Tax=Saccostrea echinata TaxID=191078 RepID=UPI002A810662|nr:uncharacterized protein LOC133186955 [Saccostrea echinata]
MSVILLKYSKRTSCFSCLEWISSLDGKYRKHCYWFDRSLSVTAFEADEFCALSGGRLAPYIDSYQYNYLLELRPPTAVDTFIGTMDIVKEDTWVNFDSSSIPGNEFLFTMTNYPYDQPNGGTTQNCAVINSKSLSGVYVENRTSDVSCLNDYKTTDMLCYKEDWTSRCLFWNSTADKKYRQHCYWLTSKTSNHQTTWTVLDAMDKCRCEGGQLAPVIDDDQFSFITNLLSSVANSTDINTGLWLGSHNIKGTPMNWNGDPMEATTTITAPSGDLCFLTTTGGNQTWGPCSYTDPSRVSGALCYKEGFVIDTMNPTTRSNATTTSVEEIKKELHVNPQNTNAFKLTKISVYEDRPVAVSMGAVGIAVLVSVFVFIILLDCQRKGKLSSKQKTTKIETMK